MQLDNNSNRSNTICFPLDAVRIAFSQYPGIAVRSYLNINPQKLPKIPQKFVPAGLSELDLEKIRDPAGSRRLRIKATSSFEKAMKQEKYNRIMPREFTTLRSYVSPEKIKLTAKDNYFARLQKYKWANQNFVQKIFNSQKYTNSYNGMKRFAGKSCAFLAADLTLSGFQDGFENGKYVSFGLNTSRATGRFIGSIAGPIALSFLLKRNMCFIPYSIAAAAVGQIGAYTAGEIYERHYNPSEPLAA